MWRCHGFARCVVSLLAGLVLLQTSVHVGSWPAAAGSAVAPSAVHTIAVVTIAVAPGATAMPQTDEPADHEAAAATGHGAACHGADAEDKVPPHDCATLCSALPPLAVASWCLPGLATLRPTLPGGTRGRVTAPDTPPPIA
jgi:hypothetical protein